MPPLCLSGTRNARQLTESNHPDAVAYVKCQPGLKSVCLWSRWLKGKLNRKLAKLVIPFPPFCCQLGLCLRVVSRKGSWCVPALWHHRLNLPWGICAAGRLQSRRAPREHRLSHPLLQRLHGAGLRTPPRPTDVRFMLPRAAGGKLQLGQMLLGELCIRSGQKSPPRTSKGFSSDLWMSFWREKRTTLLPQT